MTAPKGNQFWKARSKHGRNPIFAKPADLWKTAEQYFDWVEANPIKTTFYRGKVFENPVEIPRPMTESGLCIFLDIDETTWREYKNNDDFSTITTRVASIIRTHKFEGAAVELFNPSIIARDLGLTDKKEVTGPDGGPLAILSDVERGAKLAGLMALAEARKQKAEDNG